MSQENVEIVRRVYEAWNRGDPETLLDHCGPEVEFRGIGAFSDFEAVHRGREGLTNVWHTVSRKTAHVATIRDSLFVDLRVFVDWAEAFEAAGLSE